MRTTLIICGVLIMSIFFGCSDLSESSFKKVSKIIFLSNRESPSPEFDIFMMNPDGSNQVNLTADTNIINSISDPQLSPDGKNILFLSFNKREKDLQLLNIENRTITLLTEVQYDNSQAVFSPKGDKVLFLKRNNYKKQINIINVDGSELKILSNPEVDEYDPRFTDDGSKIVFVSKQKGSFNLCVMNTDGTERKTLLRQKGKLSNPAFSPDGESIAFVNYIDKVPGLSIISLDGDNLKNILSGKVVESKIFFTPDASKIIFNSRTRGSRYNDICIINTDGEDFKNLTGDLKYHNQNPIMIPDGRSVIFNSVQGGSDLYSVDLESGEKINFTDSRNWDICPRF